MEQERNFWLVGGDKRHRALARLLMEDGHTVHTYALEGEGLSSESLTGEIRLAHCIILPLPMLRPGGCIHTPLSQEKVELAALFSLLRPGQLVCGGMVPPEAVAQARGHRIKLLDYYAREECMVSNAVPTAEGAVQIAMEELDHTIQGSMVLILGFGRVGRLTAHRMAALGAYVTIAAEGYSDLAWAEAYGYRSERIEGLFCQLGGFDLILNTIPARILGRERLKWISPDGLILDLASSPGGADREVCEELGLRLLQVPGLPGRTAPVTAAKAIRDSIYHILREQEERI